MNAASRVTRVVEVVAAGALLASMAVFAFAPTPTRQDWQAAAFFAAFGLLASVMGYKTSRTTSGSIGFLPFLSLAVIAPNLVAIIAVFASILGTELLERFGVEHASGERALGHRSGLSAGQQGTQSKQQSLLPRRVRHSSGRVLGNGVRDARAHPRDRCAENLDPVLDESVVVLRQEVRVTHHMRIDDQEPMLVL